MDLAHEELWKQYQHTHFLMTQKLARESEFAIITAHNPLGEVLSSSQNRLLDRKLQICIESLSVPYRIVLGCSTDRSHIEKSWVVMVDQRTAITLGKQFNQNAIFYVKRDLLWLIPCWYQADAVSLGSFAARCEQVNELPDFDL
ncbi:DUF3293 domain-containing protein [Shewanella gelidii]|uniref:DUF3293 domain-containing protein n=1 Tax=Shewanella gelidii TaxID=1642821 RepID=A0A917K135_9GAMM|nr:DUF3293 domain-containing protein [Shewanella gelidii]MCL1099341.1 DUF3293 domain-containing protein [Shewanella gelidii]GGI92146.1 hypothetical protein GCM10009332_31800 [Shewanella gelidii]